LSSNFCTVAWAARFLWQRTPLSASELFWSELYQTASWVRTTDPLGSNNRVRSGPRRGFGRSSHDSQVDVRCRFGGGTSPEYLTSFSLLRCSCSTLWLRSLAPNCLNFSASWSRNSYYRAIDPSQPQEPDNNETRRTKNVAFHDLGSSNLPNS